MAEFAHPGKRQARTVDDGGVIIFVVDNDVVSAGNAGKYTQIDLVARAENDRFVFADVFGQFFLQLDVQIERAVQETRTCTAGTVFVDRFFRSLFQLGVVGQTQIAVRAEHKYLFPIDDHFGVLLRLDGAKIRINASGLRLLRLGISCQFGN